MKRNKPLPPPKAPLNRTTPIRKRNPKRAARLYREQYGDRYGEWIRTLPCAVRGFRPEDGSPTCFGRVEAAHVRSRGAGGIASDLMPLCQKHHATQHAMGIESFQRVHAIDLPAVAASLWEQWEGREWT